MIIYDYTGLLFDFRLNFRFNVQFNFHRAATPYLSGARGDRPARAQADGAFSGFLSNRHGTHLKGRSAQPRANLKSARCSKVRNQRVFLPLLFKPFEKSTLQESVRNLPYNTAIVVLRTQYASSGCAAQYLRRCSKLPTEPPISFKKTKESL